MSGDDPRDREHLRELFDKAPLPYQSLDAEGRLVRVNRAWLELLAYEEREVLGRFIGEFLTPESQQLLVERFANFQQRGRVARVEFEFVHKDGRAVPVELNGTIDFADDGSFRHTHCILLDISHRREAERRLRESEERYRNLVELAQEGIWQIDAEGRTVYVNPAMAAMLGYTPDEMAGRHLFDFMDERERERATGNLARRQQGIAEEHDFEFLTKDGRRVFTTVATRPLRGDGGAYAGAIAGVIDRTELRALDLRVLHAQKLEGLEVMAGGIAHDFNNLLQTILGNADLALMSGSHPPELATALTAIEKAAHQAAGLCRQMLAYAGRGDYAMEAVRLDELLQDLEALLRATISRKADLRFELTHDLPLLTADPTQLRQIVVNLVTNAAEALPEGRGRITVSAAVRRLDPTADARLFATENLTAGEFVVLAVRDDGCGMGRAELESVFDPFYSTKFTGRGLGLAVVRGVARAHGGAVVAESAPGQGSCFEVLLPVTQVAPPRTMPSLVELETPPPTGDGRTVLVADDDEELRDLVVRMFARLGWRAETVADGAAAVDALASAPERFALVLLDWSMPVMDGREALEAIRHVAPELPVFMSSGHSADVLAAQVEHLHPTGFLAKPYRLAELRRVLAAWEHGIG